MTKKLSKFYLKNLYIYFLAHELMIIQREMHISKLGRHGLGGDRVLCMSTDVTRHIRLNWSCVYHDWLIWQTLVCEVDQ